jgi:uncharacterized membrane protein
MSKNTVQESRSVHGEPASTSGTRARLRTAMIVIGVMVLVGVAGLLFGLWLGRPAVTATAASPGDPIEHPVADFADGKARHLVYKTPDGTPIRYFVIKSSDGVIRAAFDACDVCWRSNLGYEQQGDRMICRNCGRAFASVKINEVSGGCNPAPLARTINGDRVTILPIDLLAGRRFFDFSS